MPSPTSKIILTDRFEETFHTLQEVFPDALIYRIEADDFLIEHAKVAIEKAYLTSDREKIILLCAGHFTPIAQNKLLKIIEEPPSKTHFILATPSKSGLLATIRSRLVIENRVGTKTAVESGVDLARFDLGQLFAMLQEHRRIDTKKATALVETLAKEAMRSGAYTLDESLLDTFSESIRLLDMGSPPQFVLTRLGLKLLERKR
ncbi:DNA polymerase III subunit delta' [Hydrogenimonas sp.]|uniref:DNA polymerase III subunit delta' n=1 Tax=Hydrogenimonas sp. TaxID=2231112 RepID=UPI00261C3A89|nr:DNA polymerase III subunit delta' [Hydrogenimonas sp.]